MIVNKNVNQIDRSGGIERVQGTIAISSKSFRVISDGLYKNKPYTIVRELCCNALDSHVAASQQGLIPADKQFELHLPTAMEPYLEVRDYGVSMTPEFMMGTFSQFFNSTKTETNDQIGAMGLGSKSPLSYVESFIIKCWSGKTLNTYVVFWNEQDTPEINRLAEEPSSEPRGVAVRLDVQMRDMDSFRNAAIRQLQFFPIKPLLTGERVEFSVIKPVFSGKNWQINEPGNDNGVNAILGPVAYQVDAESLSNLTAVERDIFKLNNFVMHFNIGELDVIASREGLSYTKKTIQAIRQVFANFIGEIKENLKKELDASQNKYEARQTYRKMLKIFPNNFVQGLGLMFRGELMSKISHGNFVIGCRCDHTRKSYQYHHPDIKFVEGVVQVYDTEGSRVIKSSRETGESFDMRSFDDNDIYNKNIFFDDGTLTAADKDRRCRAYAKELNANRSYYTPGSSEVILLTCDEENLKLLQDIVDNGREVRKVSELDQVEPVKRSKTATSATMYPNLWADAARRSGRTTTHTPVEFDSNVGGLYLYRDSHQIFYGDESMTVSNLMEMLGSDFYSKVVNQPVALVSKTKIAEFRANPKCVDFFKFLHDYFIDKFKNGDEELQAFMMQVEWSNNNDRKQNPGVNFSTALNRNIKRLPDCLFTQRMQEASALNIKSNAFDYYKQLNAVIRNWGNFTKYKWLTTAGLNRYHEINAELLDHYPMIDMITNSFGHRFAPDDGNINDLARYLKRIDNIK